MNAIIKFRDGDSYQTQINEEQTPESIAHRMVAGGFLICEESRWEGIHRIIIVNLSDVKAVVIEENETK